MGKLSLAPAAAKARPHEDIASALKELALDAAPTPA
jgi:hypothetical protein